MKELKHLAEHAARKRIRGRTYKRSPLLKPLNIILEELERCPDPSDQNELDFARDSSKGLIFDTIKRISKGVYEEDIYEYVDIFFHEVFEGVHHGSVQKLLQRKRSLQSAYLVYMRKALADIFVEHGKARNAADALETMDRSDEQGDDEDEAGE